MKSNANESVISLDCTVCSSVILRLVGLADRSHSRSDLGWFHPIVMKMQNVISTDLIWHPLLSSVFFQILRTAQVCVVKFLRTAQLCS